ncbi:MAG: hypothetical protein CVT48_01845 [Thermoplasmata archaeon HGW-Thermoplasmata-1]|nr:MAG: hypothetical protein CVT48_01845 [Thermoplasmata archaeon HGW-Thermoplasmata-1]
MKWPMHPEDLLRGDIVNPRFEDFKAYRVWPRFPTISMSNGICALNCKHCNRVYLKGMQKPLTPQELVDKALEIDRNDGIGFLLSGGCKTNGEMINLRNLLPAVRRIKDETNLIVKLHTGLVDRKLAEGIVSAGVDLASMEMVGSADVVKKVFGMDATPRDYADTFRLLKEAGMPYIAPHVCIGLDYGKLSGEPEALRLIKESCNPAVLVMIALRPTKGTEMENAPTPTPGIVGEVVSRAAALFPDTEIALGCMRPRNSSGIGQGVSARDEIELAALLAGANRMELPSRHTVAEAEKMGYKIKRLDGCCAIPSELEHLGASSKNGGDGGWLLQDA